MHPHDVMQEPEHKRSQLLIGWLIPQIDVFRVPVQVQGMRNHFAVKLGFIAKMVINGRHVGARTADDLLDSGMVIAPLAKDLQCRFNESCSCTFSHNDLSLPGSNLYFK